MHFVQILCSISKSTTRSGAVTYAAQFWRQRQQRRPQEFHPEAHALVAQLQRCSLLTAPRVEGFSSYLSIVTLHYTTINTCISAWRSRFVQPCLWWQEPHTSVRGSINSLLAGHFSGDLDAIIVGFDGVASVVIEWAQNVYYSVYVATLIALLVCGRRAPSLTRSKMFGASLRLASLYVSHFKKTVSQFRRNMLLYKLTEVFQQCLKKFTKIFLHLARYMIHWDQ